jgi:hypothetical protein
MSNPITFSGKLYGGKIDFWFEDRKTAMLFLRNLGPLADLIDFDCFLNSTDPYFVLWHEARELPIPLISPEMEAKADQELRDMLRERGIDVPGKD